jgi:hypothetical protein
VDTPFNRLTRAARSPWAAALLFLALAIAMTWPLGRGLGRDVPSDFGDPLFVAWAMAWVMRQAGRALTGHLDAITHFWDANQLHPEPATLALSDHFVAQALPLAPVYWLTGNPILTLGLAYLLAFTLCGFFMWLFVREITGSSVAGVLAGTIFAFNEFFGSFELAHLQILSAHWMPLVLYFLRRYFESGSRRALTGAVLSQVALNLSSGYYLLMFPPFVVLYVAWELTARGLWLNGRTWRNLILAGLAVGVLTAPFVWPYIAAQQRLGLSRTLVETTSMAAAVDGYLATARRMSVGYVFAGAAILLTLLMRVNGVRRALPLFGFALVGLGLSFWLSLGPTPTWAGRTYPGIGLYQWLQDVVPGMNAIRVTSRFAVIFLLFLAVLAGMGASLVARLPRVGVVLVLLAAGTSTALNAPRPFRLNDELAPVGLRMPEPYLTPSPEPPAVYRYIASLPDPAVVAEMPFADLWYNTRYLYFSTFHWKPLVNGFTSFFPPAFIERTRWLVNPVRTPDQAWRALESAGTTYVVVHTGAWDPAYGRQMEEWLTSRGAVAHGRFDGAMVYQMPEAGVRP